MLFPPYARTCVIHGKPASAIIAVPEGASLYKFSRSVEPTVQCMQHMPWQVDTGKLTTRYTAPCHTWLEWHYRSGKRKAMDHPRRNMAILSS